MIKTIAVGDIVVDSREQKMTVKEVRKDLNYPITCQWFDTENHLYEGKFQLADLEYEGNIKIGRP